MVVINKVLTWPLSALLMASSLLKSVNMRSFASETLQYMEAYMPDWLTPFYTEAAVAVCSIELLAALLLLNGRFSHIASFVSVLLLTFFVWLTGVNLFFPTVFGSIESCGCFGELIHFSPAASFAKSVVIWGMAAALVAVQARGRRGQDTWRKTDALHLLVCLLISILPSACSLLLMSRLGEGMYIAGYMTVCASIICYTIICMARPQSRKSESIKTMLNNLIKERFL